jgi:NAD(P)-dependent dehydrogenase (short-subunit alcohol dehydrogenase family)
MSGSSFSPSNFFGGVTMNILKDKVALITGGGSGIGRAISILFGLEKGKIAVADWNEEGGSETVDRIRSNGGDASFIKADVSNAEDVKHMIDVTLKTFGQLHILVNNAGVEQVVSSAADTSLEVWDRVININLKGVFLGIKYGIPHLLKTEGVIVNIASTASLVGQPFCAAYAASKGGILQLTKTAALEYANESIRINCICPGAIDTPHLHRVRSSTLWETIKPLRAQTPMGRLGKPEEVAQAALFLVSSGASFITGTGLIVDGGLTAL